MTSNICNSCTNIGCEFQSGIVRTECAFYMPPHIEPDNSGNYVVIQPTVNVLNKIRSEIEKPLREERFFDTDNAKAQAIALNWCLEIIDKYKAESEDKE